MSGDFNVWALLSTMLGDVGVQGQDGQVVENCASLSLSLFISLCPSSHI